MNAVPAASLLRTIENRLSAAGVPSPAADARLIVAHACGLPGSRVALLTEIPESDLQEIDRLTVRREARVPLQHLTGQASFLNLDLNVGPGVFTPRPETEGLVDWLIGVLPSNDGPSVAVDLCAGSGAIGLALAANVADCSVLAVERSPQACSYAQQNYERHAELIRANGSAYSLLEADVTRPAWLAALDRPADVVVSNPPYIPAGAIPRDPEVRDHDPAIALYGGPDGLELIRSLVPLAECALRPGGLLAIEHADDQGEQAREAGVPELLRQRGFVDVVDHHDLAGRPRFTTAVVGETSDPAPGGC